MYEGLYDASGKPASGTIRPLTRPRRSATGCGRPTCLPGARTHGIHAVSVHAGPGRVGEVARGVLPGPSWRADTRQCGRGHGPRCATGDAFRTSGCAARGATHPARHGRPASTPADAQVAAPPARSSSEWGWIRSTGPDWSHRPIRWSFSSPGTSRGNPASGGSVASGSAWSAAKPRPRDHQVWAGR